MPLGRIIQIGGGCFTVESLEPPDHIWQCIGKGRLRLTAPEFLVGDRVEYSVQDGRGVITKILPRQTVLKRPYVANVDLLVVVMAHQNPDPNPYLLTKLLVVAETTGIPYLLIFNKSDLIPKGKADQVANKYRNWGYQVLCTSAVTHQGKTQLQQALADRVSVLAGPSGVGKSALLNMLVPGLRLRTGSLSAKIERGRHTTRAVQLLKLNSNSYAADTPGFTQIELDQIEPPALAGLLPDFQPYQGKCKFRGCLHLTEPDCRIKEAVAAAVIDQQRYQLYQELLQEISQNWKKRYR